MIFFNRDDEIIDWVHNNSLGIYSRCGLGDLIILKDFITSNESEQRLFRYDKQFLHIKFIKAPIDNRLRQNPDFIDSVLKPFCFKLFSDFPNVIFSFDDDKKRNPGGHDDVFPFYYQLFNGLEDLSAKNVFSYLSYQDMSKILFDKLCFTEKILNVVLNESYICIHTRYRSLDIADINFFRTLLLDIIGRSNLKVVLIGEQSGSCNFHSIYDTCLHFLPQEKIIDLTTNEFTSDNFFLDGYIAKRSKLSIGFGIGGNIVLNTYTGTPTYSYVELGFDHVFFDRSPHRFLYNKKSPFLLAIKNTIGSL